MTTTFTIVRDDNEIEVEIEWRFYPSSRGMRDSLGGKRGAGPPLEPDDPAELEFISAKDSNGTDVELTKDELKAAEAEAWEEMADE